MKELRPSFSAFVLLLSAMGLTVYAQPPSSQTSESQKVSEEDVEPAGSNDSQKQQKLKFFQQRASQLYLSTVSIPPRRIQFVAEPLITFENPISRVLDGFIFVWTDQGRPAVVMKGYYFAPHRHWGRTFVTLSSDRIELTSGARKLWTPQEPGVSFAPLPNSSAPAADARLRLKQMREIARRFTMVDRWGLMNPTDYQLRLLPTPLYRYQSPELGIVDGAMFGYVVNNPEALVLIEARKSEQGVSWHYAVARCTRFAVTVSLDGQQIAHYPHLDHWAMTETYYHTPVGIPDYPFHRS